MYGINHGGTGKNRLALKRARSLERASRKADARARINPRGVLVLYGRKIVESMRYLRDHGLPHSPVIAMWPWDNDWDEDPEHWPDPARAASKTHG